MVSILLWIWDLPTVRLSIKTMAALWTRNFGSKPAWIELISSATTCSGSGSNKSKQHWLNNSHDLLLFFSLIKNFNGFSYIGTIIYLNNCLFTNWCDPFHKQHHFINNTFVLGPIKEFPKVRLWSQTETLIALEVMMKSVSLHRRPKLKLKTNGESSNFETNRKSFWLNWQKKRSRSFAVNWVQHRDLTVYKSSTRLYLKTMM